MKKKIFKKRAATQDTSSVRITNETVAEHRERILAGGRKFKYPVQYARHRLVINAIIIAVVAVIVLVLVGWWQLYSVQTTNTFFYRATKVLPLAVASVDGETARYSDYLMRLRSQEHWLAGKGQIEQGKKDNERQISYIKRSVLNAVELDTFAVKLAKEKDISVSEQEVTDVINATRRTSNGTISQDQYDAATLEELGYDRDENRYLTRQALLRIKVSYAMDTAALAKSNEVATILKQGVVDFSTIATQVSGVEVGASGLVRKTNQDRGLPQVALKLSVGQTSEAVKSTTGDGYYYVRLLEINANELNYSYIKIPLTTFSQAFATLKKDSKIKEYISVPQAQAQLIK